MDVKEEDILGPAIGSHWYYVSKGRALRDFLGGRGADEVLDVGAGSGVFSRQLMDRGLARNAVCVDPNYTKEFTEAYGEGELRFVHSVDRVPQDLILMMDVLEHVDDDVGLLRDYTDRMPRGGRVLITVPAFQFLWSGHDVFLEHRRRYTLPQVESVAERAGLRVAKSRYFFGLLFPAVALLRLADRLKRSVGDVEARSQLKPAPAPLNTLLTKVHNGERHLLFPFNKMFGLTVFCLATKE